MPELPEVETIRRELEAAMKDREILAVEQHRPDLRWPFPPGFAERLQNRRIERVDRRAKYLLAHLSDASVLLMHLGMSGRFLIESSGQTVAPGEFHNEVRRDPAHDHVVFHMQGGARIVYNDARRFGAMDLVDGHSLCSHALLRPLGIEPLGEDFDAARLAAMLAGRQTSLKSALMDQRIVAGLGNIYVCEALHRAGLSPYRKAATLARGGRPTRAAERLTQAIRAVLAEAIEAGGSTLRDFVRVDGAKGAFQRGFAVYGREKEPCPKPGCAGVVRRVVQSGRSSFFCPVCQT